MAGEITLILPDGSDRELKDELTIGRDPENDLVFESSTVSRRHARLVHGEGGRWYVEDRGSRNGTTVNSAPVTAGVPYLLHHADRIGIGSETIVFSWLAQPLDPDQTDELPDIAQSFGGPLSPFQAQVVRSLCSPWLRGQSLDHLPSNEQIADALGTKGAVESVKAALRRAYSKAGLTGLPAHAKRRALCRIARQRGWI